MKKLLAFAVFFFFFASAVFAIHPLIGKWKFSEVIGGVRFYDYVTITAVNVTTKKVYGHVTGLSSWKLTGYYDGNIVFIVDSSVDYFMDGYYFTFQGPPFPAPQTAIKKHLGIYSFYHDFDASWRGLSATKLSSSTISIEIMTLSDILNQKALKKQSQIRENATVRILLE